MMRWYPHRFFDKKIVNDIIDTMAKSKQQKLKLKLDKVFSQYIRLRDSDKYGIATCITCGKKGDWKYDMQNGHYIPRNILITRFDEDNCHAQCPSCNLWKEPKQMMLEYREKLIGKLGEEKVKELEQKRFKMMKVGARWYEEQIKHYQLEVDKLLKSKEYGM